MLTFFEIMPLWMLYTFISILSLIVGSFLNVVIYRLPIIIDNNLENISLSLPGSFCPHCKNTISFFYNIPLLSYILLKGRCAHCNNTISKQYIIVELLAVFLSLITIFFLGLTIKALFVLSFCFILIALCFIDYKHQILPDSLTLTLVWIGLFASTQQVFITPTDAITGTIIGYSSLKLFVEFYKLITGKIGMGGGDIKLFAAFGAWFGCQSLSNILFIASVSGILIGGVYLFITKQSKNTRITFGPFLSLAALVNLIKLC